DIGRQAVLGVVGDGDGFRLGLEFVDGEHGAKNFQLGDLAVRIHIGNDGGLDIVALGQFAAAAFAPKGDAAGVFVPHPVDHAHHPVAGGGVDQGAHHHTLVKGAAYLVAFGNGNDPRQHFVVDIFVHQQPGGQGATL